MHRVDYVDDPDAPPPNSIVIATSTFVEDDAGRILMIHRTDNGLWALPGGGMELGETVSDCAIRETSEETGIDITISGLIGIFTNPAHVVAYPDGQVRQQFRSAYAARPSAAPSPPATNPPKSSGSTRDQLETLNIHPDTRRRIDHGLRHDTVAWVD